LGCSSVFLRRVLPALNSCAEITKIHVASKSKSHSLLDKKISGKLGIWFDDYLIAINSLCSDLVYISLPNHLHFIWAKRSLEAGLHVVIEKPATLKLSDAECLVDLSYKRNLCLAESTVWPFHPNIEIVKNNLIPFQDKPIVVDATFTVPAFKNDNFRNFPEFGGGAFNDLSAYAVSIGRVLFDEKPRSFSGESLSFDELTGIDTAFSVKMEFGKDKILKGFFGFGFDYKNTLEISGTSFLFELNRVFSPPRDIKIKIKTKIDKRCTDQFFKGDPYANFFESILATYNTKEKFEWSEMLLQDADLTFKLKSVIEA
jgi:predicted dehydrogenase